MKMRICFVTLASGHRSWIKPGEVRADVMAALRPVIDAAKATPRSQHEIPGTDGRLGLSLTAEGRNACLFTVWATVPVRLETAPITTCGVARTSRAGAGLWPLLEPPEGLARPPAPWLAVRLEASAPLAVDLLPMIADIERCVAWTWLADRQDAAHD